MITSEVDFARWIISFAADFSSYKYDFQGPSIGFNSSMKAIIEFFN